MVDISHVRPFLESIDNLFNTMLETEINAGKIGVTGEVNYGDSDITVMISLMGTVRTTLAITFPHASAKGVVEKLLGMPVDDDDADMIIDGIGEVGNIIGGGAKVQFQENGMPIDLSLPQIIKGKPDEIFAYTSSTTWVDIPFKTVLGNFSMRITSEK